MSKWDDKPGNSLVPVSKWDKPVPARGSSKWLQPKGDGKPERSRWDEDPAPKGVKWWDKPEPPEPATGKSKWFNRESASKWADKAGHGSKWAAGAARDFYNGPERPKDWMSHEERTMRSGERVSKWLSGGGSNNGSKWD